MEAAYSTQLPEQCDWQQSLQQLNGNGSLWDHQSAAIAEQDSYYSQMSLLSSLGMAGSTAQQQGNWPMLGQVQLCPRRQNHLMGFEAVMR